MYICGFEYIYIKERKTNKRKKAAKNSADRQKSLYMTNSSEYICSEF